MGRLDRLLRPKSVAVIGGGTWCKAVIEQCRKAGFKGDLWSVHQSAETFAGLTPFATVNDLPEPPDAAYIGVNRKSTVEVASALAAMGAGGAICFASGFSEATVELTDGADLQDALLKAASDMPILGPNCYGLLNYLDHVALWPDQHGGVPVASGVAIVMQSSNIAINLTMQARGLPIAYMVTVGNQAQTGMSMIGAELLDDPRVTALGLYIEGIDNLADFQALAAKAHAKGKHLVALKVGRSEQARAATVTHTASLAGTDAGAGALFKRLGIGQARTLAGFLEALKLLHITGPLASPGIAAASCSGGEASLIADSVLDTPLSFPPLTDTQQNALRVALGPKVALANPLDYHTYIWGDEAAMTATFAGLMAGDAALGCVVLDFPRADRCDPTAWRPVIPSVAQAAKASGKPMVIVASIPETMPEAMATELAAQGIAPLCGLTEAIEAISIAAEIGSSTPESDPVLAPAKTDPGQILSEAEAKKALAAHRVSVPKAACATASEDAARVAEQIGFPVALKGEGVAHKTEAGAVALGLTSAQAVTDAARAMPTQSFLIEAMVQDCVAELLIGVLRDDAHGYVLTLAAGGQLTELLHDRAALLIPVDRDAVQTALTKLRIWPVLAGHRNRAGANIDAILDTVMAVQAFVTAHNPIEVEINPLMCGVEGAVAADALIQTGKPK
ncbi:MAG: acetate--CoA ligase family protein [Paracoccaceae bacterium]|nr:acetate--CoA ligase family protein [Paracoccaceae bacterium]